MSGPEALLLGLAKAEPMRALLNDLENWPSHLPDLSKAEQCCAYLSRPNLAADEERALVRNLGWLSPDPAKGITIKQRALESLIKRSAAAVPENILALRNIELAPFAQGEALLSQAVHQWTRSNLLSGVLKTTTENANALLLLKALELPNRWWSKAVRDALKAVLLLPRNWNNDLTSKVWAWWQNQTTLVTLLSPLIPANSDVEQALINQCPTKLNSTVADVLKTWARSREWLILHAALLVPIPIGKLLG